MLSACTNGTASPVDQSQVLDVLKYMDAPSCASANMQASGMVPGEQRWQGGACTLLHIIAVTRLQASGMVPDEQ